MGRKEAEEGYDGKDRMGRVGRQGKAMDLPYYGENPPRLQRTPRHGLGKVEVREEEEQ